MANSSRIEQIKHFLQETPEDAFLQYALAIEYIGAGNDADAQIIFEDLINKQQDYFATYYHLAKLYERQSKLDQAQSTYEKGIEICAKLNERHALNELRSALDELLYD